MNDEIIPPVPADGTPLGAATALKTAGWEQMDGKHWKKNGITPLTWEEALLVVTASATAAKPATPVMKAGFKTSEFWMVAAVVVPCISGAISVMSENLNLLPAEQRPIAALVLSGLAAGTTSLYVAIRAVAKIKAGPGDTGPQ